MNDTTETTWTFTKGDRPITYTVTIPLMTADDFAPGDVGADETCIAGTVACAAQIAIAHAAVHEHTVTPEVLRFARKVLGMTRDVLAVELEESLSTIEAMEEGRWLINMATVQRMRALLGASDRGGFVARKTTG